MPPTFEERLAEFEKLDARTQWFPLDGVYVVIKLDPFASLEALNDPVVDAVTKEMETKFYLAQSSNILNILGFNFDKPYHTGDFDLVSPDLPVARPNSWEEPSFCVPILPTTFHPTGRDPLQPSTPLPWPSCYHHSGVGTRLRIRLKPVVPPIEQPALPIPEIMRHRRFRREDLAIAQDFFLAHQKDNPAEDDDDEEEEEEEIESEHSSARTPSWHDGDTIPETESIPETTIHDRIREEFGVFLDTDDPLMPVIDYFYELDMLESIPDPQEFLADIAKLKAILKSAKKRYREEARQGSVTSLPEAAAPPENIVEASEPGNTAEEPEQGNTVEKPETVPTENDAAVPGLSEPPSFRSRIRTMFSSVRARVLRPFKALHKRRKV